MATCVLIPAYQPDEKLTALVKELKTSQFDIIIVDDGSGPAYSQIFDSCREDAVILGYENNVGKGNALKLGMKYIEENCPQCSAFITADADGQHTLRDICRVRDALVGGESFVVSVRNLKEGTPFRSRLGNGLSRFMFTIANARYLPDNQSGLRGFACRHIPWMLKVSGLKYDYELNIILIAEKQGIKIGKVPIKTIYFDNNSGSHFKTVSDTARIYRRYFETNIFVLISLAIELALIIFATILFPGRFVQFVLMICWGVHALMTLVIERYTKFRWIKYTPGNRRLVISIFKYFVCFLICWGLGALRFPFVLSYIIGMIVVTVGEYYMLKVTYD